MEPLDEQSEAAAIMRVITDEATAFWKKDYDAWAQQWVHAPYIRIVGWWARGGIYIVEGWDTLSAQIKALLTANPAPNPPAAPVRRENLNLRIAQNMAWVTFDQYGQEQPDIDLPGMSRETRILEKHNGAWKIVYVGWLFEEGAADQDTA